MSVLLEALKKAAEEKKRALEQRETSDEAEATESASESSTSVQKSMEEVLLDKEIVSPQEESSLETAKIKLSLGTSGLQENEAITEPLESNKAEEPPLEKKDSLDLPSSEKASLAEPTLSLKLVSEPSSLDEGEPKSSSDTFKKENEKENTASASELKLALNPDTLPVEDDDSRPQPEPVVSDLEKKSNSPELTLAEEASVNHNSSIGNDFASDETEDLVNDKISKEVATDLAVKKVDEKRESDSEKKLDALLLQAENSEQTVSGSLSAPSLSSEKLNDNRHDSLDSGKDVEKITSSSVSSLILEKMMGKDELEKQEQESGSSNLLKQSKNDETELVNVERPKKEGGKENLKEDSDSYKWSMDSLPGYLKFGSKKAAKKSEALNPILVAGALSENPKKVPNKSSFKLLVVLIIILIIIGMIFYGFFYYQAQYEQLENRMKKYNFVKTTAMVKEPEVLDTEKNEGKLNEEGKPNEEKPEEIKQIFNTDATIEPEQVSQETVRNAIPDSALKNVVPPDIDTVSSKKEATDRFNVQDQGLNRAPENRAPEEQALNTVSSPPVSKPINTKTLEKKRVSVSNPPSQAVVVVHSEADFLSEAYSSYERGDFSSAQNAFDEVLKMNPKNEFALIGLGSIAAAEQDYINAMAYYQMALAAQPSSMYAFEAIANIAGHIELNSDWKASLLSMVKEHPESAILQYALGNLYAKEQDWLAAQKAYFQAHSLDLENADYMVNLAVSLDQLGHYELAAQYYTEALALADRQTINFSEVQVKDRLITIRQFIAGRHQ